MMGYAPAETIRQLFFDASLKLPPRVVLHKRTPFLKDEREGLLHGLRGGVTAIDMLEIQEDHALRYVASMARRDGTIDEDNYPVRRGTVMKLDDFTALLWVHGATAAVNPSPKYFQGKRRIPAPLAAPACRRYAALPALRGSSRPFQDELEHIRPLYQVPGDASVLRRNRPHWLAAPAVRRVLLLRLPTLYLARG